MWLQWLNTKKTDEIGNPTSNKSGINRLVEISIKENEEQILAAPVTAALCRVAMTGILPRIEGSRIEGPDI
ncbi:hypothetical protein GCM10025791_24170 [Halioxenophilus aromaticivorans]|uniref:Uncharacterized protein n=1 Tax=Halioxenophilus aromaticivorans TaxID=1306992 RepID=A0AAV3U2S0_9ALTE